MKGILEKKEEGWFVKWSDLHSFTWGTHWIWTPLQSAEIVNREKLKDGDEVEFEIVNNGYDKKDYTPLRYAAIINSGRDYKINWIKWWLQRYGDRDEDTFTFDGEMNGNRLYISMQYNYTIDGEQIEPYCLFKTNNKLNAEYIHSRTNEELDMAIETLKSIKK